VTFLLISPISQGYVWLSLRSPSVLLARLEFDAFPDLGSDLVRQDYMAFRTARSVRERLLSEKRPRLPRPRTREYPLATLHALLACCISGILGKGSHSAANLNVVGDKQVVSPRLRTARRHGNIKKQPNCV
jgi:hypothetical protein